MVPVRELISVNVGVPREVTHRGRGVRTGIFKQPVPGRVRVGRLNLDGDRQADLRVHGGVDKAVYAYPAEHYPYWLQVLGRKDFPFGQFGENLTVRGMQEDEVRVGDVLAIGTARLQVSQPRSPCFKLGIRMDSPGILRPFLESGRIGFYLRVLEEGEIGAGDRIELVARDPGGVSVREISALYHFGSPDREALEKAVRLGSLAPGWRAAIAERLAGI
jgi:MOSC domain-containing protein YiiM